jgi:UDP-N-acetylglucosamine--N-acetylmuramyl-(pentapeptide) pyrophosphoryl-undecaprenol N-acetylglucosamine transferase
MKGSVYIVAGGTGGHINGALSIGATFSEADFDISYISGKRFLDFKLFLKEKNVWHLNSWPLRYNNPVKQLVSLTFNALVFFKCFFYFLFLRPTAVIGCGGYVCGPVLSGAKLAGIPCFIVEQNACAGITNRILAHIANKIFVHFKNTKGLENFSENIFVSGNPIRNIPIVKKTSDKFTVLVFGGSLGATQINESLANVIKVYNGKSIKIIHQGGKESEAIQFDNDLVEYHHLEYIDNIYECYETADLIISRAGASSVSELQMLNTNCILIPYPQATNDHQYYNAIEMQNTVDCEVIVLDSKKDILELSSDLNDAILELIPKKSQLPLVKNIAAEAIRDQIIEYVF